MLRIVSRGFFGDIKEEKRKTIEISEEEIAGKECMEKFRKGASPLFCKEKLGKLVKGRCFSSKDNAGGPKIGFHKFPGIIPRVSPICGDRTPSIFKVGRVHRALAESRDNRQRKGGRRRFLLSSVHGSKRREQMASNHRSFFLKYKAEEKVLQDGRFKINSKVDKTRYVGGEVGSEGRLFSCPTSPINLEVFQVRLKEKRKASEKLLFQEASVRAHNSAVGIFKDPGPLKEDSKITKYNSLGLSGRFSYFSKFQRRGCKTHKDCDKSPSGFRLQDKLGQIFHGASKSRGIPRGDVESGRTDFCSPRRKNLENLVHLPKLARARVDFKENTRKDCGISKFCSKLSKVGKTVSETSAEMDG